MAGTMFPFDELNRLKDKWSNASLSKEDRDWLFDDLLDLFLLSYTKGCEQVMSDIPGAVPYFGGADDAIWTEVAEEFWDERLASIIGQNETQSSSNDDQLQTDTGYIHDDRPKLPDLVRLAETEAHRIYCAGAEDTAIRSGAKTKTWKTMQDVFVRDTHDYLEGVSAPVGGTFTTFDGDSARYPGDFNLAENNVNCRCYLTYS